MLRKLLHILSDFFLLLFWAIGFLFIFVHQWIFLRFGTITFDQMIFHAKLPVNEEVQMKFHGEVISILQKIGLLLLPFLCFVVAVWIFGSFLKKRKRLQFFVRGYYAVVWIAGLLLFVRAIWLSEKNYGLCSSVSYCFSETSLFDSCAKPSYQDFIFPEKKRNCILIFSESLEKTYANQQVFGEDLIPELTNLANQNLSFQGHHQVNGTGWTAAGMTAALYGLPRLSCLEEGFFFSTDVYRYFMPEMPSVLKIAAAQKYNIAFVRGATMQFQSAHLFLDGITNKLIWDRSVLQDDPEFLAQKKHGSWGVNDRITMRYFKKAIEMLGAREAPFFAVWLTDDTHFSAPGEKDGFVASDVKRKYNDMRDVISEQSKMIAELVAWIQQQSFYENTTVVILGDHLAMKSDIYEKYLYPLNNNQKESAASAGLSRNVMSDTRQIYNCFINLPFDTSEVEKNRIFATFDFAPTILHAMGIRWNSNQLGIGTSLFVSPTTQKTLLEEKGIRYYETESRKHSDAYWHILCPDK